MSKLILITFISFFVLSCNNENKEKIDQTASKTKGFVEKKSNEKNITAAEKMKSLSEAFASNSTPDLLEVEEAWNTYMNELNASLEQDVNSIETIYRKDLTNKNKGTNFYDARIAILLAMASSSTDEGKFANVIQLISKRADRNLITKADLYVYHTLIRERFELGFVGDSKDVQALFDLAEVKNPLYKFLALKLDVSLLEGQDAEAGPTARQEEVGRKMLDLYLPFLKEKDDIFIKSALFRISDLNTAQSTDALEEALVTFRNDQKISSLIENLLKSNE